MSADPALTRFLLSADDAWVSRARAHWDRHGFGHWVVEIPGEARFIGVVGLVQAHPAVPASPAVEIAWRLCPAYWRHGYASEAAQAAIDDGFTRLGLGQIIAITVPQNLRSRAVMERLGMTRNPAEDFDFDHPLLPPGHPLRRHVLYRLGRE